MKRDDDLIRDILLRIEASEESSYHKALTFDSSADDEREHYHLKLLCDAGYCVESGRYGGVFRLTNQGHDYLNVIRDGDVWIKVKDSAKKIGGGTLGLLKDIATELVKAELKTRFGFDI